MNLAPLALLLLFLVACALWWRERNRAQQLLRERSSIHRELEQSFEERQVLARGSFIAEERERIYADLHQDIDAQLARLVDSDPAAPQARVARNVLESLRETDAWLRRMPRTLPAVLAEIRGAAARRLQALGVALDWQQASDVPDLHIEQAQALYLYRAVRQSLADALDQGPARHVRIRAQRTGSTLTLDLAVDDRHAEPQEAAVILQLPLPADGTAD